MATVDPVDAPAHPELGFYALAGASNSPAALIDECHDGERLGFDKVFLSARFNAKEIATISGVAGTGRLVTRVRRRGAR